MECSTEIADRVELARRAAEALGHGLVLRYARDESVWVARLAPRDGVAGEPVEATGPTPEDAAEAGLAALRSRET